MANEDTVKFREEVRDALKQMLETEKRMRVFLDEHDEKKKPKPGLFNDDDD